MFSASSSSTEARTYSWSSSSTPAVSSELRAAAAPLFHIPVKITQCKLENERVIHEWRDDNRPVTITIYLEGIGTQWTISGAPQLLYFDSPTAAHLVHERLLTECTGVAALTTRRHKFCTEQKLKETDRDKLKEANVVRVRFRLIHKVLAQTAQFVLSLRCQRRQREDTDSKRTEQPENLGNTGALKAYKEMEFSEESSLTSVMGLFQSPSFFSKCHAWSRSLRGEGKEGEGDDGGDGVEQQGCRHWDPTEPDLLGAIAHCAEVGAPYTAADPLIVYVGARYAEQAKWAYDGPGTQESLLGCSMTADAATPRSFGVNWMRRGIVKLTEHLRRWYEQALGGMGAATGEVAGDRALLMVQRAASSARLKALRPGTSTFTDIITCSGDHTPLLHVALVHRYRKPNEAVDYYAIFIIVWSIPLCTDHIGHWPQGEQRYIPECSNCPHEECEKKLRLIEYHIDVFNKTLSDLLAADTPSPMATRLQDVFSALDRENGWNDRWVMQAIQQHSDQLRAALPHTSDGPSTPSPATIPFYISTMSASQITGNQFSMTSSSRPTATTQNSGGCSSSPVRSPFSPPLSNKRPREK